MIFFFERRGRKGGGFWKKREEQKKKRKAAKDDPLSSATLLLFVCLFILNAEKKKMSASASESEGESEGEGEVTAPKNLVVEDFLNAFSVAILMRVGTKPQNHPDDGKLPQFDFVPSLLLSIVRGASFIITYFGILGALLSYAYGVEENKRVLLLTVAVLGLGGLHGSSFLRDMFKVHYMHVLVEESRVAKEKEEKEEESESDEDEDEEKDEGSEEEKEEDVKKDK